MISLKQFILNTQGTKQPTPWGTCIGQCVSLVQQYITQCLGQPAKARGNAVDWDETYVRQGLGTITDSPRYGDLIVFNPPYAGKYGHIAIYINASTMYDQNNGSHDDRNAGYAKLMRGGVYIRPNADLIPDETDDYTTGVYKLNANMRVRLGAGTNYGLVKVKQTTSALRNALVSKNINDYAVIKKGTKITALDIIKNGNQVWLKNYSGYVCIKGDNGEYCIKD